MIMEDNWIVLLITTVIMVTHGYTQNLSVSVVSTSPSFEATDDVEVTLIYTNKGSNDVSVYNWHIRNKALLHPMFKMSRDGKDVEYVGPLLKRSSPTDQDITILKSGEVLRTAVELSKAYNMSKAGTYTVQFAMGISSILQTSSRNLQTKDMPSERLAISILQSPAATFYAKAHQNPIVEKITQINKRGKAAVEYEYLNCTQLQQTAIANSIQPAISYAAASVQYLTSMNIVLTPRYNAWFGKYALSNVITVRKKFTNIYTALATESMLFDCECRAADNNTFAYVYRDFPYYINLCPMFWLSPITGTDSRAGTLLHEVSHFTIVAGNTDTERTYGHDLCQALARFAPFQAANNADNFEYFAENDPIIQ